MAKREVIEETQATRDKSQWRVFAEQDLEKYRNADSVQICQKIYYLKILLAERDIQED